MCSSIKWGVIKMVKIHGNMLFRMDLDSIMRVKMEGSGRCSVVKEQENQMLYLK